MRILFASMNLPVPATNGQAIRSLSIIQGLQSIGHEVNFISFARRDREETLYPLSTYCRDIDLLERELTNLSQHSDYFRRVGCVLSSKPYSLERFRSEAMRGRIQSRLKNKSFDLIISDGIFALTNVPPTDIPIALNCHNVEHIILQRYSRIEKNPLKKCYALVEARLVRTAEHRSCRRAAVAMVCSTQDRQVLRELAPDLPISVIPNTVDTDLYRPDGNMDGSSPKTILFQGGMDWYPNRDAVEFFARDILPLVRAEYPEVKFVIAGRNPPAPLVEKLKMRGGIEFTGTVPDMRPYLSLATVVVVPLRLGSGTRIKILEACAAGKPIVSTRVGAEGLELEEGKDIMLADDPAEFSRAIISLMRDPLRSEALARSARSVVVQRYSHQALTKSLEALISSFGKQGLLVESIQ